MVMDINKRKENNPLIYKLFNLIIIIGCAEMEWKKYGTILLERKYL